MNAKRVSTVRFEAPLPESPQEWRRRAEAEHEHNPLPPHVLLIVMCVSGLDPALTMHPMDGTAYNALRQEFKCSGFGTITHDELCRAVVLLSARQLEAPWWRVTAAQLARYSNQGRG